MEYTIEKIMEENENDNYENYKKDVVSMISYLIGVKESSLKQEKNFNQKIINDLDNNEDAKIIHALCTLRTEYIKNFKEITNRRRNLEPIESMNDILTVEYIQYLRSKDIETVYVRSNLCILISYLNQNILENIDKIKYLIPSWIKWEYVKGLFLMPKCYAGHNGIDVQTQKSIKKVTDEVNKIRILIGSHPSFYPHGTYINWKADKMKLYYGNIFFNDEKFLKILYSQYDDTFRANDYVIDATKEDKQSIYDFIEQSTNIAIFVDCENVDPYKFASVFRNLNENNLKKIKKVILYDDKNTTNAWDYINTMIHLPLEHNEVSRLLDNKSLVDMAMVTGACKEYYQENTDSLILASSDSDFWELIKNLPNARFYILNESQKTSNVILDKLEERNINYCFMDSFAQSEIQDFKDMVLYKNLISKIKEFNETACFLTLNPKELVDKIFQESYIQGSYQQIENEKEAFFKKYVKKGLKINVVKDGDEEKFEMELVSSK